MLHRRGTVYTSRVVIPGRIQALVGRVEITRSLRTTDLREARWRLSLWESHLGVMFRLLAQRREVMTRDQAQALVQAFLDSTFDDLEARLSEPRPDHEHTEAVTGALQEFAEQLSMQLVDGSLSHLLPYAREQAPAATDQDQRELARKLTEVKLQAVEAEITALGGRPLPPRPVLSRPTASPSQLLDQAGTDSPSVSQVASQYCEERIWAGKWSHRTARQSQKIFEVIASLLDDAPVGSISKARIRQLGLEIIELPTNMTKRFPGLSAKEVLAQLDQGTPVERLAPRSVNKYYLHVRSIFGWAQEHDHIAQNPCVVLRDVEEGRAQDARDAFDDSDIRTLFAHLATAQRRDYELWVPRVMALTGCRMGEAAQLRSQDVRQEAGVWVFDFNEDDEGKSLKTENSRRLVPVHPRLIELGLLEWVGTKGNGYLLPEAMRKTDRPERSNIDRLSKRLSALLRRSGITDERKVMQSFRSTVATRLKNSEVPEYVIAEILGHENDNITTGRYGKKADLAVLKGAISKLDLPV